MLLGTVVDSATRTSVDKNSVPVTGGRLFINSSVASGPPSREHDCRDSCSTGKTNQQQHRRRRTPKQSKAREIGISPTLMGPGLAC